MIGKLSVLLDEVIGLVRDTRALVQFKHGQALRSLPDLFGPKGTEIRFEQMPIRIECKCGARWRI